MNKVVVFAIVQLLTVSTLLATDGLSVGDKAPDFELESLDSATVKLSERFGPNKGPTVLLFSRANW